MEGQDGYGRLAGDEDVAVIRAGGSGGGGGDDDDVKLRLLGYEPQLKRNLSYVPAISIDPANLFFYSV